MQVIIFKVKRGFFIKRPFLTFEEKKTALPLVENVFEWLPGKARNEAFLFRIMIQIRNRKKLVNFLFPYPRIMKMRIELI